MAKKKADLVDSGTEIVKAEKKKPRGVSKDMADGKWLQTEPGDNTKIVLTNMKFFNMPAIDLHDPTAVQERLCEYFQIYGEADLKPTVAGMGMALGLDRRRLWEIKTGAAVGGTTKQSLPTETLVLIKKAYEILETTMENYANAGKINPVMAIFMMKNHFGYQDKTEYVLTPNQKTESDYDADEISKRYLSDSATINPDSPSDSSDS
jgi:hypothetical protein